MKIWKYVLELMDTQYISMPNGALALSVDVQKGGMPCLWVMVDPENETRQVCVKTLTTGQEFNPDTLDPDFHFVGTYQLENYLSYFVGHVFFNEIP